MSNKKFAVIGIGHFGRAIALSLARSGADVMAIDSRPEPIDEISDDVAYAVAMDATDKKALLAQDIFNFDVVIVAIGENFVQRLHCVAVLMDLNVKRIVARARGHNQQIILQKMGITEVICPEDEVGTAVAHRLLKPNMISYLDLLDNYCVMEVIAPKKICGMKLGEIAIRDKYKLSLITIRREFVEKHKGKESCTQHILGVPDTKVIIEDKDTLILFGLNKDIERFLDINGS